MIVSEGTKRAARVHAERLFALPNVNGVGYGKKITAGVQTDIDAVMVFVEKKKPIEPNMLKRFFLRRLHPDDAVPALLDGAKTDVVYADEIFAPRPIPFVEGPDPTERWRPYPAGVSIGHYNITAGTLGCVVRDKQTGKLALLSNNHVLADSNRGKFGDDCLQPGSHDGGTAADHNSDLGRFRILDFSPKPCPIANFILTILNSLARSLGRKTRLTMQASGTNTVDCAIAFPINEDDVRMDILVVGDVVPEPVEATVGMNVQKFGRTTRYTADQVIALDASVSVNYGVGVAMFEQQIIAGPMSAGGDSGSLVLDMQNRPVGLLFAGSEEITIMNPIQLVLDALEVEFI
jgi:hypothetical protein